MSIIKSILIIFVAIQHIGFLVLEMFLWKKPIGQKIFALPEKFMHDSASLAANQGLYNGFLAAGLIWSFVQKDSNFAYQIQVFFISCVLVAGIFGAFTASKKILYIQALPALITLVILIISHKK